MNKKELIKAVSANVEMPQNTIAKVVDATFDAIVNTLAEHEEEVSIAGFGKFVTVYQEAKECRNPQTGEPVMVDAKYSAKFKPASALKEAVK